MAAHSSTFAWRIPWTEEPGGLPSMGSHRVGYDWSNLAAAAAATFYLTFKRIITPMLLLSCFSCVQLCATPETAAHQAPPSLGFSSQEHWSGLPFPSPMHKVKSESEVAQSRPTPSDPMDCSLPGSSVHGILQAKVLEWGAIAFSDIFTVFICKYLCIQM